jgi:hypothetical protein
MAVCGAVPLLAVMIRAAVMAGASSHDGGSPLQRASARVRAASSS